jgi:L-asparaginase
MLVILGTGGTIAGQAADAADNVGYKAGQLAVEQLIQAVPSLSAYPLECEQVAQLDSKDMDFATWQRLARAVERHLARPEVQGLVITHGTDTLEETAFFLQRLLAPTKPVVLTAAMRPATALLADGPQNMLDAVRVASLPSARGVVTVLAGKVYGPEQIRKVHSYRLDAFASSDGGQLALVEEGVVRLTGAWPGDGAGLGISRIDRPAERWPRVQIVWNHVGADGSMVDALLAQGVDGIVVAATGNGTVSAGLEAALRRASEQGVAVVIGTRCDSGAVIAAPNTQAPWRTAGALSPVKARIDLLLALLGN